MLVKDIPLERQLALLNNEDKNNIGSLIFGDLYDQDCVDKIWSEIKELPFLKIIREPSLYGIWSLDYYFQQPFSFSQKKGEVKITSEQMLAPYFYKTIIKQLTKNYESPLLRMENPEIKGGPEHRVGMPRWCLAPQLDELEFYVSEPAEEHLWDGENVGDQVGDSDQGGQGRIITKTHKQSMLSDFQIDPHDYEYERTPHSWITENNNQANLTKVRWALGQDPRRRYLREQYHIISENYSSLASMWGITDEEELRERVKEWNIKANLWSVAPNLAWENGAVSFVKNQSDIKYYKDYLKIQLGLCITPFKNHIDKVQYDKVVLLDGQVCKGFIQESRMGFRKSRWRKLGIGEVENYNCSLLNYIGREPIFEKDNQKVLFVKDAQYIIRN